MDNKGGAGGGAEGGAGGGSGAIRRAEKSLVLLPRDSALSVQLSASGCSRGVPWQLGDAEGPAALRASLDLLRAQV